MKASVKSVSDLLNWATSPPAGYGGAEIPEPDLPEPRYPDDPNWKWIESIGGHWRHILTCDQMCGRSVVVVENRLWNKRGPHSVGSEVQSSTPRTCDLCRFTRFFYAAPTMRLTRGVLVGRVADLVASIEAEPTAPLAALRAGTLREIVAGRPLDSRVGRAEFEAHTMYGLVAPLMDGLFDGCDGDPDAPLLAIGEVYIDRELQGCEGWARVKVWPLLSRHANYDWGGHGGPADFPLDDDATRWLPLDPRVGAHNVAAVAARSGIVRSAYIVESRPQHPENSGPDPRESEGPRRTFAVEIFTTIAPRPITLVTFDGVNSRSRGQF
jgi:hypothetical protein